MKSLKKIMQQGLWAATIGVTLSFLLMPRLPVTANATEMSAAVAVDAPSFSSDADAKVGCDLDDQFESRLSPGQELALPQIPKRAKRASKKARLARVSTQALKKIVATAFSEWDVAADQAGLAQDLAPKTHTVEDDLLNAAVEESFDRAQSSIDWRLEGSQLDTEAALGFQLTRWELPIEIVGQFQKTDFSLLHSKFKKIRKAARLLDQELQEEKAAPALAQRAPTAKKRIEKTAKRAAVAAPRVALAQVAVPQVEEIKTSTPPDSAPKLFPPSVRPKLASADFAAGVSEVLISKLSSFATEIPEPVQSSMPEAAPEAVEPSAVVAAPPVLAVAPNPEPVSIPQPVAAQTPTLAMAPLAPLALPIPPQARAQPSSLAVASQSIQKVSAPDLIAREESFGVSLQGRVPVENAVRDFLASRKASLEVYLVPASTTERRELIPVLAYPEEKFRFDDARRLKGSYRLVALAMAPDSSEPIGRAVYHKEISAENARENIYFPIRLGALLQGATLEVGGRLTVPVTLSVFEGASSEAREPNPVPGAKVWIAGLQEQGGAFAGPFIADNHGDVENLPEIPIHSRLLFIVSSNDHLLNTQAVSVGTRDPEGRIFLVRRPLPDTFSWMSLVLSNPVAAFMRGTSVITGRVYDASVLQPLVGEEVLLQGLDHEKLAYYGPASNKEPYTQSEGFFSFFPQSGFQVISRPQKDLRNFRMKTRPGSGYYVELGKMGAHLLQGLVEDFFDKKPIAGAGLQVIGDKAVFGTSAEGKFQVHGLEYPAGRVEMEFRHRDYPRIVHTAPYNPLDRMRARKYAMISTEDVNQILYQNGMPKWSQSHGMLVGKALESLFDLAQTNTLTVEVRTPGGKLVSGRRGPFPVRGSAPTVNLTKQYPAFAYWNLLPGEYITVFKRPSDGQIVRVELVDLEADAVSVVY